MVKRYRGCIVPAHPTKSWTLKSSRLSYAIALNRVHTVPR